MIIVSQKNDKIVNSDNIFSIKIRPISSGKYYIEAYGYQSYTILGEYDTKERAQEVFDHIIDRMGVGTLFARLPEVN